MDLRRLKAKGITLNFIENLAGELPRPSLNFETTCTWKILQAQCARMCIVWSW
jgi:hypothetical protein